MNKYQYNGEPHIGFSDQFRNEREEYAYIAHQEAMRRKAEITALDARERDRQRKKNMTEIEGLCKDIANVNSLLASNDPFLSERKDLIREIRSDLAKVAGLIKSGANCDDMWVLNYIIKELL